MASSIPSPTSSPSCSNDLWEEKDRNAEKSSLSEGWFCIYHYKLTNLKYHAVTVNSTKENCGNPQKSYTKSIKVLYLQKKNAEIRKNLSCYDYLPLLRIDDSFMKYVITGDLIKKYQNDDGIVFMDVFDFLLDKDSIW